MTTRREEFRFPTRQYPYRKFVPSNVEFDQPDHALLTAIEPGKVYRFVLGVDPGPVPMPGDEIEELLCDAFAELLLKQNVLPVSARELLARLDESNASEKGVPRQRTFLVADGGQIRWNPSTADVNRQFRLAVSREGQGDRFVLISTSTSLDSNDQFLQVLSWDERNEVYNYYERRHGSWMWAGNSKHALEPKSRSNGPFDSHVNGSLVMKELKAPWLHWHSMDASITSDVLAPDDPFRNEPVFVDRVGAQEFEDLVRARIALWDSVRLKHYTSKDGKKLHNTDYLLRQVLTTTTANLVTSDRESRLISADDDLVLPHTFFLNTEALLDRIGLSPDITAISVKGRPYLGSLEKYEFKLMDRDPETGEILFEQDGDTFFAFAVPEPAFEDLDILDLLLRERLISRRFAACILMIDFQNPVFSERRTGLLRYVPADAELTSDAEIKSNIEELFVNSVAAVGAGEGTVEAEFLANWGIPVDRWESTFVELIEEYFRRLRDLSGTDAGFDGWARLAESRRREFKRRPLAEFSLTLANTNIPSTAPLLEMKTDGTVAQKS